MGLFDPVDLPVLQFLTGFVGQAPLFDHLLHAVSRYDSFKGIPIITLFWVAWFRGAPAGSAEAVQARRRELIAVLFGAIGTVALSRVLQLVLHLHQRPILAGLGLHFPDFIDPASVNPWNSFPSDHSMLFFSLATGLWRVSRPIGAFVYGWSVVVIDLPRLYLGLHYPSDIVVGSVLGVLCMLGFLRMPLAWLWGAMLDWGGRRPGAFYGLAFVLTEQLARLFDDLRRLAYTALGHVEQG